jgi:hypothetical protein
VSTQLQAQHQTSKTSHDISLVFLSASRKIIIYFKLFTQPFHYLYTSGCHLLFGYSYLLRQNILRVMKKIKLCTRVAQPKFWACYGTDNRRTGIRFTGEFSSFFKISGSAPYYTQSPFKRLLVTVTPTVKRPEREAGLSASVKNGHQEWEQVYINSLVRIHSVHHDTLPLPYVCLSLTNTVFFRKPKGCWTEP